MCLPGFFPTLNVHNNPVGRLSRTSLYYRGRKCLTANKCWLQPLNSGISGCKSSASILHIILSPERSSKPFLNRSNNLFFPLPYFCIGPHIFSCRYSFSSYLLNNHCLIGTLQVIRGTVKKSTVSIFKELTFMKEIYQ